MRLDKSATAIPALVFGHVHRLVGVFEKHRRGTVILGEDGKPDTRTHRSTLRTIQPIGAAENLKDTFQYIRKGLARDIPLQQHDKLVAPDATGGIAGPDNRFEALRHFDQNPVAGLMAMAVVNCLEPSRSR